jgi:HSP20 family protein
MTLVRYQNQFPSLFKSFFDNEFDQWSNSNYSDTNTTLPSINIKENNENFVVEVAAPGFEKSDFNIELNNEVLTISSDKQIQNEVKEDEKFTKREFSYQSFTRSFTLPELVEGDQITAKYDNGILGVTIPKKEEAKPKPIRQIKVA